METSENIKKLIHKEVDGSISDKELRKLVDWLFDDRVHWDIFEIERKSCKEANNEITDH